MELDQQDIMTLKAFAQGLRFSMQTDFTTEGSLGHRMGTDLRMSVTSAGMGGSIGLQNRLQFIENKIGLVEMTQSIPNTQLADLRQQIEALRREVAELTELNQIANNARYGEFA